VPGWSATSPVDAARVYSPRRATAATTSAIESTTGCRGGTPVSICSLTRRTDPCAPRAALPQFARIASGGPLPVIPIRTVVRCERPKAPDHKSTIDRAMANGCDPPILLQSETPYIGQAGGWPENMMASRMSRISPSLKRRLNSSRCGWATPTLRLGPSQSSPSASCVPGLRADQSADRHRSATKRFGLTGRREAEMCHRCLEGLS
jgi:hypothetical protein